MFPPEQFTYFTLCEDTKTIAKSAEREVKGDGDAVLGWHKMVDSLKSWTLNHRALPQFT